MSGVLDSHFKSEQLSVFLENRAGCLSGILHILASQGINVRAVSLADTSDFGILRMMVSDLHKAESALKANGFTTGRTSVLAVELDDTPGSLDSLLAPLSKNGINVEYMYAYARRDTVRAVMIFRFDKQDEAIEILRANSAAVIAASDLNSF